MANLLSPHHLATKGLVGVAMGRYHMEEGPLLRGGVLHEVLHEVMQEVMQEVLQEVPHGRRTAPSGWFGETAANRKVRGRMAANRKVEKRANCDDSLRGTFFWANL